MPPSTTLSDFSTPGFGNVEKPELKQGQTLRALQVTCTMAVCMTVFIYDFLKLLVCGQASHNIMGRWNL